MRLPLAGEPAGAGGGSRRPRRRARRRGASWWSTTTTTPPTASACCCEVLGAEVRVAHDGREALEAFSAYDPAVVLLDIGMPGMDGYEVARRIRAHAPDAPRLRSSP